MEDPSSKPARQPGARPFRAGALRQRIIEQSRVALEHGALRTIESEHRFLEDNGVAFIIRVVSNLARKYRNHRVQQTKPVGPGVNPFLPPDPDLLVADVSTTHLAVLNKFNVIEQHLLIVTRSFEHQETLLSEADFSALWRCLREFPSLGFYNGGEVAGASQAHKHLQLVPLPFADTGPSIPIGPLLQSASPNGQVGVCDLLPFRHAFVHFDREPVGSDSLLATYMAMLEAVGLGAVERDGGPYQSGPYNLLITTEWMLLVPRSKECFGPVSINGLGYAGSLFVKNKRQAEIIEKHGPLSVLTDVGIEI
jgi:ATP adenylyltransferase